MCGVAGGWRPVGREGEEGLWALGAGVCLLRTVTKLCTLQLVLFPVYVTYTENFQKPK